MAKSTRPNQQTWSTHFGWNSVNLASNFLVVLPAILYNLQSHFLTSSLNLEFNHCSVKLPNSEGLTPLRSSHDLTCLVRAVIGFIEMHNCTPRMKCMSTGRQNDILERIVRATFCTDRDFDCKVVVLYRSHTVSNGMWTHEYTFLPTLPGPTSRKTC